MIRKLFLYNNYLFYICLFAVIIRFISIFVFVDLENPEMWEYGLIARNMLSGLGFSYIANTMIVPSAYMPPGLPYIYYFFFLIFGDNSVSYIFILLFNLLISIVSIIVMYKLSYLIFANLSISILSALYAALSPIFIYSTVNFNSIVIYHVLIGLIYLYFLKLQKTGDSDNKDELKNSILLGIITGVLLYFRADGTAILAILFLYFLFKKRIRTGSIILILAIVIISPWTIRNYIVFDKIIPVTTSMGYNFYLGHSNESTDSLLYKKVININEDAQFEIERSTIAANESIEFIKSNPDADIKEMFSKIYSLWLIDKYRELARHPLYVITWLVTLILFFYGYYLSWRNNTFRHRLLFLNIYLIFSTLLVIFFFNIPRYQIQMSIIIVPIAMFGLYNILIKINFPINKFLNNETHSKEAF